MALSKAKAAEAVPFAEPSAPVPTPVGEPKGLTIKLTGQQYAALRDYCISKERETGKRVTHQGVVVKALEAFLER